MMIEGNSELELREPVKRPPVLAGHPTFSSVTQDITSIVLTRRTPVTWFGLFYVALLLLGMLGTAVLYLLYKGVGIWGVKIPVAWAFAILNFVFWIGIGHAGTFISAILLLLEQKWRTSINRFAEAMTLFAVIQAGLYPLLHLGRPWFAYWLVPYPSTMGVWPNFRSALPCAAAAARTYLIVSLLFWYMGLVPDLAVMRDASKDRWRRRAYGLLALVWRGSSRD